MKIQDLTRVALMLALLVVCSQIAIPVGPVPITLQTLIVLIIGLVLPPKQAVLTTVLYIVLGLVGLPVFAQSVGGLQAVFMPSFGFVLAFVPAAWFMSTIVTNNYLEMNVHYFLALLFGNAIIYSIGIFYMNFILTVYLGNELTLMDILMAGMVPFIPGDFVKSVVAYLCARRLKKLNRIEVA